MPTRSLSSMSADARFKFRDEIEKGLSNRAAQLRAELSKLSGKGSALPLKGRKAPVKYRDRAGNTWAGRGAQPKWLRAKLRLERS